MEEEEEKIEVEVEEAEWVLEEKEMVLECVGWGDSRGRGRYGVRGGGKGDSVRGGGDGVRD